MPVTSIRPSFEVHSTLDVNFPLIPISLAYGYMRAADVVGSISPAHRGRCARLTDEIISMRMENVIDEKYAATELVQLRPASLEALKRVRDRKWQIWERYNERVSLAGASSVPEDVENWWLGWERRRSTDVPTWTSPWVRIPSSNGLEELLPAVSPPT